MIFELFAEWGFEFLEFVFGGFLALLPGPPGFAQTGFTAAAELWGTIHTIDTWVPVTLTVTVALAVMGAWLISTVIGVLRVLASYLTFGGGAT